MNNLHYMLPEWEQQEAIILAWPDMDTDWAPWLTEARLCYLELIKSITDNHTGVLLLIKAAEVDHFVSRHGHLERVVLVVADYNDTWVRDYGFLCCQSDTGLIPVEYQFNGWGQKFDATKDNLVNQKYLASLCQHPLVSFDLVCEGGALEIDQNGHLLSTELCLTNQLRNGEFGIQAYQKAFSEQLGAKNVSVLKNGHLEGDDTDGHIDTIVRYTPEQGLVIQSCFNAPQDPHFEGLSALVKECRNTFPEHQIYELPLPRVYNQEGERLPASYANYLINNQQVICPVYQEPEDQLALEVLANAYPNHTITPINSRPLVQQFGSIHCISMQVPKGVLKTDVVNLFSRGVTVYEPN